MFSRLLFMMSALAAFAPWTFAQNSTPAAPGLTYLYTLNCTLLPPYIIGAGPRGFRVAIPITGGYFNGPKLSGKNMCLLCHSMQGSAGDSQAVMLIIPYRQCVGSGSGLGNHRQQHWRLFSGHEVQLGHQRWRQHLHTDERAAAAGWSSPSPSSF